MQKNKSITFSSIGPGRALVVILAFWYGVQLFWFATKLGLAIAPDEPFHIAIAQLYADAGTWYLDAHESLVRHGAVVRHPYLAHLLLGKLSILNVFAINQIVFMRYINVAVSLMGFYFSWRFFCVLLPNVQAIICALSCLLGTLMFVVMGGAVSYDPWTNTFAAAGSWLMARLLQSRSINDLLALGLVSAAGALAKVTFLPLATFFAIFGVILVGKNLLSSQSWREAVSLPSGKIVAILFSVVAGLSVKLYLTNVVSYQGLFPECSSVYSAAICDKKYAQDLAHRNYENANAEKPRLPFPQFAKIYWTNMEETAFGLVGHKAKWMSKIEWKQTHRLVFYVSVICLCYSLINKRQILKNPLWLLSILLWVFYGSSIMIENYLSYLRLGQLGAGLQGRYFFPVLTPFFGSLVYPIFQLVSQRVRWGLTILICLVSLAGGFPFAMKKVPETWFSGVE